MPEGTISKPLLSSLQLMDDNEELQSLLSSSHCSQDHLKSEVGLEVAFGLYQLKVDLPMLNTMKNDFNCYT